ncbi:MAG: hypothetical protein ACRCXX_08510 [Cetobacterium sp.]|uniref:hypothetical protein n=1 Tax=Cetobacterium sp. TaxID=2071632 RepID=UPI003F345ECD
MNITNDKLMEILERNLGLPMGDGGIFYIEDPGQKRINKIYFSKTNMSLYKCTADNTDVTVTGNFKLYSLSNTDDYLGALTGVDRGQVKYIQDVGTKYVDKVYIDRPTGKLYRCVTQTSSVNNDANFVENNLKSTDGKLQNLDKTYIVHQGVHYSKIGNTVYATARFATLLQTLVPGTKYNGTKILDIPSSYIPKTQKSGCIAAFGHNNAVYYGSYTNFGTITFNANGILAYVENLPIECSSVVFSIVYDLDF